MEEGINIIKPTETIKLSKMAKAFQWEIKLIEDENKLGKEHIKRLEELNNEMMQKFGDL